MTSTRSPAQKSASIMNGTKSRGPVSDDGKARSAMNRVRHGVRARRVLLEGESVEDYESEAECWVLGLDPQTDAETEIVLDVVDVRVRLGRLEKAERARVQALTTKDVAESPEHQRLALTQNAITLLSAMKLTINHAVPAQVGDLAGLLPAVRNVMELVKEVEARHSTLVEGLVQLEDAIEDLLIFTGTEWPSAIFAAMSVAIDPVAADLHRRAVVDTEMVREIEIDMTQVAVPANDAEGRRLEGYRRQLERRLQAHLDLLEQLRRLRPGGGGSGSFVRPVRVNLRPAPGPQALAHG